MRMTYLGRQRSFGGSAVQPMQFAGEQVGLELGLVFLRARYYDPDAGRFLTRDGFPGHASHSQTVNRYVYVGNNPAIGTDPSGLFNLKQFGG